MNDNNFYMLLPLIAILNSKQNRGPSNRLTHTLVLFMEGQGRGLNIHFFFYKRLFYKRHEAEIL